MNAVQQDPFEAAVSSCRSAYSIVLELEKRTHSALYKALGLIYIFWHQIQGDARLRARFNQLLANRNKPQRENPILFLVQFVIFPHLLSPGSGNKPDQDKASRYATLLNLAWQKQIPASRFVEVAPQLGIQKTASSTVRAKRTAPGKTARSKRATDTADGGPVAGSSCVLARDFFPEDAQVAHDLNEARLASYYGRQKLQLSVYVEDGRLIVTDDGRIVVTEAWSEEDHGKTQIGITAITHTGTAKTHPVSSGQRPPPKQAPTPAKPLQIGTQQPAALANRMPSRPTPHPAKRNQPVPAEQPMGKRQHGWPAKRMPDKW
jgi:hypothetical protein